MTIKNDARISPTCRYNHGPLYRVDLGAGEDIAYAISPSSTGVLFVGKLYTCRTCGYCEFFDDEPERTYDEVTTYLNKSKVGK